MKLRKKTDTSTGRNRLTSISSGIFEQITITQYHLFSTISLYRRGTSIMRD